MTIFNQTRQRLSQAASTANRSDAKPASAGPRVNAPLGYSIATPPARFEDLSPELADEYVTAVSAAANGDVQSRMEASAILPRAAEHDISEVMRINRLGSDLDFELARITATPAVRAALPRREIKLTLEIQHDIQADGTTYREGDRVHGSELQPGTIRSLLSGKWAREV